MRSPKEGSSPTAPGRLALDPVVQRTDAQDTGMVVTLAPYTDVLRALAVDPVPILAFTGNTRGLCASAQYADIVVAFTVNTSMPGRFASLGRSAVLAVYGIGTFRAPTKDTITGAATFCVNRRFKWRRVRIRSEATYGINTCGANTANANGSTGPFDASSASACDPNRVAILRIRYPEHAVSLASGRFVSPEHAKAGTGIGNAGHAAAGRIAEDADTGTGAGDAGIFAFAAYAAATVAVHPEVVGALTFNTYSTGAGSEDPGADRTATGDTNPIRACGIHATAIRTCCGNGLTSIAGHDDAVGIVSAGDCTAGTPAVLLSKLAFAISSDPLSLLRV